MIAFRPVSRCAVAAGVAAWFLTVSWLGCGGNRSTPSLSPAATGAAGVATENRLRVGDEIQVHLDTSSSRANAQTAPDMLTVTVDEHGEISLPLAGRIPAAGQTPAQLAERIEANYVPRFYVRCNVSVIASARYYYVGGEVRAPGRYGWSEDVTFLKAINTAGGFTDYANRGRVEVLRGDQKIPVDFEGLRQNPGRDIALRPGDSIWVPRSIF